MKNLINKEKSNPTLALCTKFNIDSRSNAHELDEISCSDLDKMLPTE